MSVWSSHPRSFSPPLDQTGAAQLGGASLSYSAGVVGRLKVFVGGLSQSLSEDEMRDYFSQFGSTVADAEIKIDKITGRSRGFGFVTILNCDSNKLFTTPHKLANKTVDVAEVTETKIVVSNLKATTTIEQIVAHFSRFGNILCCEPTASPHASVSLMTVVFETSESANSALGEASHFIDGAKVEVRKAEPKSRSRFHNTKSQFPIHSNVSTTVNTPVISGVSFPVPSHAAPGYGAFGGYGEFDVNQYTMHAETRILAKLEYGALGPPSSYGSFPVPGYDMLPGIGSSNRYHPIIDLGLQR